MPGLRRFLFVWWCCLSGGFGAVPGTPEARMAVKEWILPPLDGELSGEFDARLLGGAPRVKWHLTLRTEAPLTRSVQFTIDGYGVRLRGEARLDPAAEGTWKISEAEINLGEWFGWVAPRLAKEFGAFSVAGTLSITGEGTWREGKLGGTANVQLRGGRVENTARRVVFEGVECNLAITDLATLRTAPMQLLTWQTGKYDVVPLGQGRVEFELTGDQVQIAQASIGVFGGTLGIWKVEYSLARPEFSVSAHVDGFELGQLLFLKPELLSRARGRLDGYIDLTRDERGLAIGTGYLGLREGETAELQFFPRPGVLSAALPPVINRLYPGLAKMESEGAPFKARVLQIDLTPGGDAQNRTAVIHVAGEPVEPTLTAPFDLTVNVRGPLDQVLNLGGEFGLRLQGGR